MPDLSRFGAVLSQVSDSDTELREIPLSHLCGNPANFYPPVPAEELEALADSIAANGLLEPLLVVDAGGVYKLISGHNRLRALQALNAHGGTYRTALCRVLPRMDPAHELTAIIESNRQRKKSPALLAKEAEKLTEAYAKRKAAGEELPGRIRDRVAADLGVSPTKLGNLSAIERGLVDPELLDAWRGGELPESLALRLARLDPTEQSDFAAWVDEAPEDRDLTGPDLDRFLARWDDVEEAEPEAPAPELVMGSRATEEIARSITPEDAAEAERHVFRVLPTEPEGQMVLAGWMPGGVDPGEPGLFAAVLDLDGKPLKRLLRWQGGQWTLDPTSTEVCVPVLWWLRLPPVPGEEDRT